MAYLVLESDIVKNAQRNSFKFNPVAAAIALAITSQFAANVAQAGAGFAQGTVRTYYANSPAGPATQLDATTGASTIRADSGLPVVADTGKALRKFVDTLPGIPGITPANLGANNLGQYIPLAVAEKWIDLNGTLTADDYYEIAAVEFSEKMHSDLASATRMRGYVQLSTARNPGKHIALTYPGGVTPIRDATGAQVYAYDNPHHLGPIIRSVKGTAVRVKFTNYLPIGTAGELFIPVDGTITGAAAPYTQNRASIRLVGGQAPWISAGSPHQWVAPAGETAAYAVGLGKGASAQNVPDMADPGPGSSTLYFPNDMSARFMFYQDRTSGLTRLNAYAGLAAGYLVTDPVEQALVTGGTVNGVTFVAGTLPADQIPLIIEDKTFVPDNIAQQDAKWDTAHWGKSGDLWFPHVYETNQDPTSVDGTNPAGRWDFGPWFWPIFPATYALPTGGHTDPSFTPEAYHDTPVINGTAYPTLTVSPKAYRLRILNASNDRYINLGLFKADGALKAPQLDRNGNPIVDASGNQQFFSNTEVRMVPAVGNAAGQPPGWDAVNDVQLPLPKYPGLKTNINVESSGPSRAWPVDSRIGGAPDPTTAGPDFIVIGNDGGLLPNPVDVPAQPVTYEANRRSITVGNIYGYGLLLGPAERADAIVDFSQYAGQTLILYNDAPAPAPFTDSRNDYFTGGPDQSAFGGAYPTQPGYGPNTRTMMQIKVSANGAAAPFNSAPLLTELPKAYKASQPMPIVPAVAYNNAFGSNDPDIYAHVATGSSVQPKLEYSTTGSMTLTSLDLITSGGKVLANGTIIGNAIPGSGTDYDPASPPAVVFNNVVNGISCLSGTDSARATVSVEPTTRQVSRVTDFYAGSGYTCAPIVTFTPTSPISTVVKLSSGGSSYTAPIVTISGGGGQGATATASFAPATGEITGITVTNQGNGYTSVPTITITDGGSGAGASAIAILAAPVGIGAQAVVKTSNFNSFDVLPKAEQELFDASGRYNSTGGVEIPWTNGLVQTTIPLNYIDSATEVLTDGEVQIWKLVDNGFWSNSIHFDMADVQLINRVGWDGTVKPPASNEVGWKDTLRLNPLEDVIVAMRARRPNIPFGLPRSSRLLDPSTSAGSAGAGLGFTVAAGLTPALASNNVSADFDNEFTWGSAILGHAENDFTRPVIYRQNVLPPAAPSGLADVLGRGMLTWTDPTPAADPATLANPKNEVGFRVQKGNPDGTSWSDVATVPANVTRWTDPTPSAGVYKVFAFNAAGDSAASNVVTIAPPSAPDIPNGLAANVNTSTGAVSLSWSAVTPASGTSIAYVVRINGTPLPAQTGTSFNPTSAQMPVGGNYSVTVAAQANRFALTANSVPSPEIMVDLSLPAPSSASALAATLVSATSANLTWVDNASNEMAYLVSIVRSTTTGTVRGTSTVTLNRTAAQGTATGGSVNYTAAVLTGSRYSFTVTAQASKFGVTTSSAVVGPVTLDVVAPAAPTSVSASAGAGNSGQITLTWTDAPRNASGYTVQRATVSGGRVGGFSTVGTVAVGAQSFTNTGLTKGRSYQYQVRATGVVGNSAYVRSSTVVAP